jgi:hypothetical protein
VALARLGSAAGSNLFELAAKVGHEFSHGLRACGELGAISIDRRLDDRHAGPSCENQ